MIRLMPFGLSVRQLRLNDKPLLKIECRAASIWRNGPERWHPSCQQLLADPIRSTNTHGLGPTDWRNHHEGAEKEEARLEVPVAVTAIAAQSIQGPVPCEFE